MELSKLKAQFDKDYCANQTTREKAADDLVFYWITQWDDQLLNDSPLKYRGEFNVLRKAGRQIMTDLRLNPVQPDFKPKDMDREEGADLLDGIYRAEDRSLSSQEAYDYGSQDAIVCGFGAWELYTKYASNNAGDERQIICRDWIPEANNTVFWDANARTLDKRDAMRCTILKCYTEDGYRDLVEELTGERPEEVNPSNFAQPEESFVFPWVSGGKKFYVATVYCRKRVTDKVYTFRDPMGEELRLRASDIEEVMDDLIDTGHEIVGEREIKRWEVRKYICSGEKILNGDDGEVIAGEHIPVVPVYGERAIVEGEEHWEGVTRLAKDPQRLRNFQMSYLADIVSRSPRPKPIFQAEQIQGFEAMYEEPGADNNYPYLLQNRVDGNGNPLPIGPVAELPEQRIPQALAASIELTKGAIEDVANPGVPQDIADPDLSGKAVAALQNRIDQQSYIYQHNFKFAKRRDAEIFASMASQIFDTPRTVTVETPDGNRQQVQIMDVVIDKETGNPVVLNDITGMEFDVYAEIGQQYSNQVEQTRDRLARMIEVTPEGDPARDLLLLKLFELTEGPRMDDVREFARKRLILNGYKDPETEEEVQMLQAGQEQAGQQKDPNMVLAEAEALKAQADVMREQREAQSDAAKAQTDVARTQIDAFEAATGRYEAQIKAEEASAKIRKSETERFSKRLDDVARLQQSRATAFRQ